MIKTKDNIGVITLFASVADFIATNDWFQKAEICLFTSEKGRFIKFILFLSGNQDNVMVLYVILSHILKTKNEGYRIAFHFDKHF